MTNSSYWLQHRQLENATCKKHCITVAQILKLMDASSFLTAHTGIFAELSGAKVPRRSASVQERLHPTPSGERQANDSIA